MIESGQRGMIVEAVNASDGIGYSASVVATRKRITVRNDFPDGVDKRVWEATFGSSMTFDIMYEAAVWRGRLKPLTVPLLVLQLAGSTRHVSQDEFGALVNEILTNGNLSDSASADLETMLRERQFVTRRHVLRTFPLMKKIPALCILARHHDEEHEQLLQEMGWTAADDEPKSYKPDAPEA